MLPYIETTPYHIDKGQYKYTEAKKKFMCIYVQWFILYILWGQYRHEWYQISSTLQLFVIKNSTTIRSLLTRNRRYFVKVKKQYWKGSFGRAYFHVFINRHDEKNKTKTLNIRVCRHQRSHVYVKLWPRRTTSGFS